MLPGWTAWVEALHRPRHRRFDLAHVPPAGDRVAGHAVAVELELGIRPLAVDESLPRGHAGVPHIAGEGIPLRRSGPGPADALPGAPRGASKVEGEIIWV